MASPNFDSLVQRLSILLRDYVASASSNGATYDSVDRVRLINEAQRTLWDFLYSGWAQPIKNNDNLVNSRFTDFIDYVTFSVDSSSNYALSGLSLKGSVIEILAFVRNTDKCKVTVINKGDYANKLQSTIDSQLSKTNPVVYLNTVAQTLAVRPASVDNNSVAFSAAILRFPFTGYTVNYATDIEWNPSFFDALLNLAYAKALYEDGDLQGYLSLLQMQFGLFGYNENILNNPNLKKMIK